jgi:hypothetical protein
MLNICNTEPTFFSRDFYNYYIYDINSTDKNTFVFELKLKDNTNSKFLLVHGHVKKFYADGERLGDVDKLILYLRSFNKAKKFKDKIIKDVGLREINTEERMYRDNFLRNLNMTGEEKIHWDNNFLVNIGNRKINENEKKHLAEYDSSMAIDKEVIDNIKSNYVQKKKFFRGFNNCIYHFNIDCQLDKMDNIIKLLDDIENYKKSKYKALRDEINEGYLLTDADKIYLHGLLPTPLLDINVNKLKDDIFNKI